MQQSEFESSSFDKVILAPEGFIDQRYLPAIKHSDVSIIEVRTLADGPVFHTIHLHPSQK